MIRTATIDDLVTLADLAAQFYASSKFLNDFNLECFETTWTQLLSSGMGAVFVLDGVDGPIGALGGVAYPDINSGRLTATEFFWFVDPAFRGKGLSLYKAFEDWARSKRCSEIRMVHLADSMPSQLERLYERLGFDMAEVHYRKELS